MRIRNKLESIDTIKRLKLNKFPEELFSKGDIDKVKIFLDKYPASLYAIRDKSKAGGIFKLGVPKDEVLDNIKEYELFTINVSSLNYASVQILVGEIQVLSSGDIYLTVSKRGDYSVRDAVANPDINIKTNTHDNYLKSITGFFNVYYYIIEHNLIDVIVEFSLFKEPVGIYNENIIIYEVRTDY